MLKPETLKEINKGSELPRLANLEDDPIVTEWRTSNCPSVDLALGRGLPVGRIVEFFGPKESGKTALCLSIARAVQDAGEDVVWIDAEHALVPEHLRGLDESRFYVNHPEHGEEATDVALAAIAGGVGLVVVDSVPALVPKAETEGTMEQIQVGALARLVTKFVRKAAPLVARSESTLVFINHERTKVGVVYGNPLYTPGGSALGYYASVRARVSKVEDIKQGAEVVGMRCRVKSDKNRCSPRVREGFFDILFTGEHPGIDREAGIIDAGIDTGVIINKSGHMYLTETSEKLGYGRDAVKQVLREDPSRATAIYAKILETV